MFSQQPSCSENLVSYHLWKCVHVLCFPYMFERLDPMIIKWTFSRNLVYRTNSIKYLAILVILSIPLIVMSKKPFDTSSILLESIMWFIKTSGSVWPKRVLKKAVTSFCLCYHFILLWNICLELNHLCIFLSPIQVKVLT